MEITKAMRECWKRGVSFLTSTGQEVMDPTPIELPVNCDRPPDILSQIRMVVDGVYRESRAREQGLETIDEAEDFNTGEDNFDPSSPWEDPEMGPHLTHEAEMRSGAVEIPDFQSAKALRDRCDSELRKYVLVDGKWVKKPPEAPKT